MWSNEKFVGPDVQVYGLAMPLDLEYSLELNRKKHD